MTHGETTSLESHNHNKSSRTFIPSVLFVFLATFAGASFAQVSRPAALLDVTIPSQTSVAISLPFNPFSFDLYATLGEQLGENASVLLWNARTQAYEAPANLAASSAGDAFWIINDSPDSKHITLSGLVSFEHTTITVIPQLNLIGNPSVSAITNNHVTLEGDDIIDPRTPETQPDILPIGQGMWYTRNQSNSAMIEIESPLTAWPEQENAPEINSITINSTGSIHIVVADEPGTQITLYGQDVPLDGALQPDRWKFISDGIVGQNHIVQLEEYIPNQTEVGNRMRCYLVAVSGTDVNSFLNHSFNQTIGEERIDAELTTFPSDGDESSGIGYDIDEPGHSSGQNTNEFSVTARIRSRVIYVSNAIGKDQFTGEKQIRVGNDGPKKSIHAALIEATDTDTVVIMEGVYDEPIRIGPDDGVVHIKGTVRVKNRPSAGKTIETTSITNRSEASAESGE